MYSRRDFTKLALAGEPAALSPAPPESTRHRVLIGAQSYSFRDRSLDDAIKALVEVGLSEVELSQGHAEPRDQFRGQENREALRKWRTTISLDEFRKIRAKFNDAGINLYALNY